METRINPIPACPDPGPAEQPPSGVLPQVPRPRRPRDFSHLLHLQLALDAVYEHRGALVGARLDLPDGPVSAAIAGHALAALAAAHAVSTRILEGRWCDARDALVHGATVTEVAAAMDLDVDGVRVGVRAWADGQQRLRKREGRFGLSPAEADEVRALVDEGGLGELVPRTLRTDGGVG